MDTKIIATAFDYDDSEQRIVVEQRFNEAQALLRQGLMSMIEAGGKFGEIRELLRHNKAGGFEAWIDTKGLGRHTVYRIIHLHDAFATVTNLSQLDISASAAYLLAAPSVPEAARAEAIEYAAAGERVTVAKAQELVNEYRPAAATPAPTPERITAAVRSWLSRVAPGNLYAQKNILKQLTLGNATGLDHLDHLADYVRRAGVVGVLTADLKRAVNQVSAEFIIPAPAPARVVYTAEPSTPATRPAPPEPPAADPSALPDSSAPAAVIAQYLALLAEENAIPTTASGAPERDAVRHLLQAILADRGNGGGHYWRQLRAHPAWPAAATDADKLAAVRAALEELRSEQGAVGSGQPAGINSQRPAAAPRLPLRPERGLFARKQQHIHHLVVAVDKALGYLKALADQRDGDADEELLETIAALQAARAEALHED